MSSSKNPAGNAQIFAWHRLQSMSRSDFIVCDVMTHACTKGKLAKSPLAIQNRTLFLHRPLLRKGSRMHSPLKLFGLEIVTIEMLKKIKKDDVCQFLCFCIVGTSNAVIDFGVLNLLLWLHPTADLWKTLGY